MLNHITAPFAHMVLPRWLMPHQRLVSGEKNGHPFGFPARLAVCQLGIRSEVKNLAVGFTHSALWVFFAKHHVSYISCGFPIGHIFGDLVALGSYCNLFFASMLCFFLFLDTGVLMNIPKVNQTSLGCSGMRPFLDPTCHQTVGKMGENVEIDTLPMA
jgi:hypothetical protein